MFKDIKVHATFNERTGYGIHASRFFAALKALCQERGGGKNGEVAISLLDTVSASNHTEFPAKPSILYNVWESTEQPVAFIKNLQHYTQLWVPSEWQRACSIAQGIPEEFVKVVPEGVDPDVYKPGRTRDDSGPFVFLHVGQWQPRKSTLEIIQAYLKAFPLADDPLGKNTCLQLSVDTLFHHDQYKTTEERLAAYGINDPRISIIHFEERDEYIRRLQNADCFVTCARSEGWNLPLIEAMACGVICTTTAFGGSTEYAQDAINIRVRELKKVDGIYGGWDCPGQWAEPDYDHLAEQLAWVYRHSREERFRALQTSEMIRTKFSWKAAAEKAYAVLESLYAELNKKAGIEDIVVQAKKLGYEIGSLKKINAVFSIDCHPSSPERVNTLIETIHQVREYGYPVLVVAHLPLPPSVIELCDYYIYDRNDILSGDDRPVYTRVGQDGKMESVRASIPCHALAGHNNVRNALDFCRGRFDWIYHMNSDAELDLDAWIARVRASDKPIIAVRWENQPDTFGGQIVAGKVDWLEKLYPRIATWEEFAGIFQENRFCSEKGYYKIARDVVGLDNIEFIENFDIGNRFDQVDRDAWPDDVFSCNFIDGPVLEIAGLSRREYDVSYTSADGKVDYKVKQKPGMWSRPAIKYYKDWTITARLNGEVKFQHTMDLKGKKVLICLGSKALGDTLAWIPYVDEFRKKHECRVVWSGWWPELFDYSDLEFVPPGTKVDDVYASYNVGCYDGQLDKNVVDWRTVTLQKVASDILGLEYRALRPRMKKLAVSSEDLGKDYVCFSEHSTMKAKLWNRPGAWQETIDYINGLGLEAVSISREPSQLKNVVMRNGRPIEDTIKTLLGCKFYIGLGHGPSWLAWALGIPVIMISGFSAPWAEFPADHRIINQNVCNSCFNRTELTFDRGWDWCPTKKDYECTKAIVPGQVIDAINKLLGTKGGKSHASKKGSLPGNGERKHRGAKESRVSA